MRITMWGVSPMWMLELVYGAKEKMLLFGVCERCFVVMAAEGVPLSFPLTEETLCSCFFFFFFFFPPNGT